MKKRVFVGTILLIAVTLTGCSGKGDRSLQSQSAFKANFSLETVIEAHQDALLESARALSGAEAGPQGSFIQRQEEMVLRVDADDSKTLFTTIQADVREDIEASGARILGSVEATGENAGVSHFSFDYREGDLYGSIHVWGVRANGDTFIIIAQITENQQ